MDVLYTPIIRKEQNQVTWVIKVYHNQNVTNNFPAMVTFPTGAVTNIFLSCRENSRPKLRPQYVQSPSCEENPQPSMFVCVGHFVENITKSGTWVISSIFGVQYYVKILVAEPPQEYEMGPYVVKTNIARQVLIEPKYQIKWIHVPLQITTVSIKPSCQKFVKPLMDGWERWLLQIASSKTSRIRGRRDLAGKVLGGLGTGLGVVSAIDNARLAKNITKVALGTQDMVHPIEESIRGLDKVQLDVAELLPMWIKSQEEDHLKLIQAMQDIQNETALALACVQIQSMLLELVRNIIREALTGRLPLEIATLVKNMFSPFEQENPDLWTMLHSQFDPVLNTLHLMMLTVIDAHKEVIFPIATLGMFVNGSVLMPTLD